MNQTTQTQRDRNGEPRYLALAREAALAGLTREQVITALQSRIRRDAGYLAYRKAVKRHTTYDEQVEADLRAMALAICYLYEPTHPAAQSVATGGLLATNAATSRADGSLRR
jgi:hypothetical protein